MRGNILLPVIFVVVAFAIMLTSGALVNKTATDPSEKFDQGEVSNDQERANLQLKDLSFTSRPTPVPPSDCNHDMNVPVDDPSTCKCVATYFRCENKECKETDPENSGMSLTCDITNPCPGVPKDGWYCWGKPVIYLYPERRMPISVKVITSGEIYISDPLYPAGGWDVIANPGGKIEYRGQEYKELFYETKSKASSRPRTGIVLSRQNIENELRSFVERLGLTKISEQDEFLDWWIPQLKNLKTDRIFASIIDRDEKNEIDRLEISPKPDTLIDFLVYFAPLKNNETVTPLVFSDLPKRQGFTVIEWGGTIGR